MNTNSQLPHVVIVGAGFGGLQAATALAGRAVRVTLVDRNNHHLFQPLLFQVATSGLAPHEIAMPVRALLRRRPNLAFRMADVRGIDLDGRTLQTSAGPLNYDYLILAAGARADFFGLDGVERYGFGLKSIDDALRLRNHLLRRFEQAALQGDSAVRRALLTFVVVGGGPIGVESAGAIAELARRTLTRDYPQLSADEMRVVLLEAGPRLLAHLHPDLSARTAEELRRKQVEVRLNTQVQTADGQGVLLADGERLPAHTVLWAAGMRAAPLHDQLPAPRGAAGRVAVTPQLNLPGRPEVYVIGDAAYLENAGGRPLPMMAPVAIQQGEHAARNILSELNGRPRADFTYRDRGSLAVIGRNQAVAQLGRLRFAGFPAWLLWLGVHLTQLRGPHNRLSVLLRWLGDYFLGERSVRLILPDANRPGEHPGRQGSATV